MELAFERHATSKIRQADDLAEVKSMGFRGEALASIAAIAKVEMKSKTEEQEIGNKIVVEGGKVLEIEETGCPKGTTITVENLFFNTPVRYKFLKKDYTETGYIEDVITRLALVHPEISFKLINSGKTIIQTTGDDNLKNVIYSIYGKSVASACLNVNYTYEGITITGVVGKPEIARSNRGNQIFFVNKRYVKDRILSNATEKAFKGMIPIGKFGFLILNLEMQGSGVDVNVHPAKLEVRFVEEQKVFKAVYYAIQDTLLKAELIANSETQITGKLEKGSEQEENDKKEKEEEKNSISGLFRKIAKNANNEQEYDSNNVIESIYRSKNEIKPDIMTEEIAVDSTTINIPKEEKKNTNRDYIKPEVMQNSNTKIDNKEEIKNTIDEFLKMGQSLTAEQIREKIAELSFSGQANNRQKEEINNIIPEETKQQELLKTNIVSDVNEKYETRAIDTREIEKLAKDVNIEEINVVDNQNTEKVVTPGEILTNLAQERTNVTETKEEPKTFEEKFDDMYAQIFGKTLAVKKKEQEEDKKANAQDIVSSNMNIFEETEEYKDEIVYKFIGIAFKTYIILEIKDELYILDQHAAHERIMYEKVKKNYYSEEEKDSQLMLLPDVITLTHKEMDIARENFDKFEKAGFVLEEFGENTIKLTRSS